MKHDHQSIHVLVYKTLLFLIMVKTRDHLEQQYNKTREFHKQVTYLLINVKIVIQGTNNTLLNKTQS